jgi:hypothetical protein
MQWIARLCFLYGVVGALATIGWCTYSFYVRPVFPETAAPVIGQLVVWAVVAMLTFPQGRRSGGGGLLTPSSFLIHPLRFEPVLGVTPFRVRIARWAIAIAAGNALIWTCVSFILNSQLASERNPILFMGSVLALTQIYFAAHWGLRPEHVFADTRLEFVLGRNWRKEMKLHRRLRRMAFRQRGQG